MSNKTTEVAGEPTQTGTALLETATAAIQGFVPINKIHRHLWCFHFYADDTTRQVEAHHFCSHQNEDVRQCQGKPLFLTLLESGKPLWHSHEYDVKSGILFMTGIPGPIERQDLEKVVKAYGKTFHFWQVDRPEHVLPLGLPQIMMSFTRDGQLYDHLAKGR